MKSKIKESAFEIRRYTSQSIEDGTYFTEAFKWYLFKFCRPLSERSFLAITAIIVWIMNYFLYLEIKSWLPLVTKSPIVLKNSDSRFAHIISPMEDSYHNPDYAILGYLIKNYVKTREEFTKNSLDLLKIDARLRKIANNSTQEVYQEYQDIFSFDDDRNPINRLGETGIRIIQFKKMKFNEKEPDFWEKNFDVNSVTPIPKSAKILFSVSEGFGLDRADEVWEANLDFYYSGIVIDKKYQNLALDDFIVRNYNSRRIK